MSATSRCSICMCACNAPDVYAAAFSGLEICALCARACCAAAAFQFELSPLRPRACVQCVLCLRICVCVLVLVCLCLCVLSCVCVSVSSELSAVAPTDRADKRDSDGLVSDPLLHPLR